MIALFIAAAPIDLRAQTDETEENVTVTHGGYGAFGGALAFAIFSGGTLSFARLIYAPPLDADCDAEPQRCKPNALDHTLVGLAVGASVAGVYFSGWGAQKFAESKEWDAPLGWALSGGYLGLPVTLLLQNAIPNFSPDWLRQTLGLVLAAGGSFGAGYAFREFALQRGHAWPEFGFGAGGLAAGLTVGTLVARDTVWAPIIGGLTSVAAASVAHFAFPP
jgi:hypothetical protein